MALPRNVQAQVDAADALLAQANPAPDSVQDAPALEDLAKLPSPSPEFSPPVPPTPTAPATVEPEPTSTPPKPAPDVWEARYKAVQGLFNKEVPALQQQVRQLTLQGQQAAEQLEALRKAEQVPTDAKKPEVDPRDVESFGSDLVDMVQRVIQAHLGGLVQKVESTVSSIDTRIAQLEREVQGTTQTVAMTAEQSFFERLTKQVPEWESINANEAFLAWLSEEDPVYGAPRQTALDAAQRSLNADRAAAVFRAFSGNQPTAPAPKPNPLDKQVSPRAVATPEPTPQANAQVLTQKQITDFYADLSRGKYRGREADAQRIEQVINQALAEGRVR